MNNKTGGRRDGVSSNTHCSRHLISVRFHKVLISIFIDFAVVRFCVPSFSIAKMKIGEFYSCAYNASNTLIKGS